MSVEAEGMVDLSSCDREPIHIPGSIQPHGMLLAVITRFEEQRVKRAVRKADPKAFMVVTGAHEVLGKVPEDSLHRLA